MAFYTDGVVPWNSLDDNTRAPLSSELEAGYPCGEADQQLFNWTAGWPIGNIWNMIASGGLTPDTDSLLGLARAVQSGKTNYAVAGGTANALTATLSPAPATLSDGMSIDVLITATNTGAATLSVNGLGADPIQRAGGGAIIQGDLPINAIVTFKRVAGAWQIVAAAIAPQMYFFTIPGTSVWTCPLYVTRALVRVWGGGGGGGAGTVAASAGAGGGGGGYTEGVVAVTPGQSYNVTVGNRGSAGIATSGGNGGTSSFGSLLTATGGGGGAYSAGGGQPSEGAAGVGSGGQFNPPVQSGGEGSIPIAGYGLGGFGGASFAGAGGPPGGGGATPGGGGGAGANANDGAPGGYGLVIIQTF